MYAAESTAHRAAPETDFEHDFPAICAAAARFR
jgi:hypothetical protein